MTIFRSKKALFIITVSILLLAGFKLLIYDNPKALYIIAEGLDEPSLSFYKVVKRIYSLSRNKSEIDRILSELESGKNEYLHTLYIRTIGIVGGEKRDLYNYVIVKTYTKYQSDKNKSSIVCAAIDSLGFIANRSTIKILEELVENYDNYNMIVAKYPVARALYLSTGNIRMVREKSSMDFIETSELKIARKVLERSKGRYRTIEEMLLLANLNRPEKFKMHFEDIR